MAVVDMLTRRGFLIGVSGAALAFVGACSSDGDGDGGSSARGTGAVIGNKFGETRIPPGPQRVVSVGYNDQDAILALGATPVGVFDWYGNHPNAVWPWAQHLLAGAGVAPDAR